VVLRSKRALVVLLGFVAGWSAAQTGSAIERFHELRAQLQQARKNMNWSASLTSARELATFLNESPDSLLELARAEVHVGNLQDASRELEQFVRMGQAADLVEKSPEFTPLREAASFADIQKGMKLNSTSTSLSSTAFELSDSALLPEDIDYDQNSRHFFITSVREKKIVSSDLTGVIHDLAKAADGWPMLAIKVDSQRQIVWATEVALNGFVLAPEADWGRSAVLCYALKDGKLLRRVEAPRGAALGDMVLMPNGDIIVSDGEGGGVYRLRVNGQRLERIDNGEFISPQTPAVHPDGKHVFVPDYVRGIGLLEIATKRVNWLPMDGRFALNGIDGLYFDRGRLIAVQNGTSPERVVAFALGSTLAKIRAEKIIERSTETLGDPTHGVIIGDDFYYIANSGWDIIDEHGNIKPGAKLSMPRVMRVHQPLFAARE